MKPPKIPELVGYVADRFEDQIKKPLTRRQRQILRQATVVYEQTKRIE